MAWGGARKAEGKDCTSLGGPGPSHTRRDHPGRAPSHQLHTFALEAPNAHPPTRSPAHRFESTHGLAHAGSDPPPCLARPCRVRPARDRPSRGFPLRWGHAGPSSRGCQSCPPGVPGALSAPGHHNWEHQHPGWVGTSGRHIMSLLSTRAPHLSAHGLLPCTGHFTHMSTALLAGMRAAHS